MRDGRMDPKLICATLSKQEVLGQEFSDSSARHHSLFPGMKSPTQESLCNLLASLFSLFARAWWWFSVRH